jgi:hypothetical protein
MEAKVSWKNNHFGGVMPFRLQVNFDIPIFEGQIDVYILEKWSNLPKGYCSVQKKFDGKKIIFMLLKYLTHVKSWWKGYGEMHTADEYMSFKR